MARSEQELLGRLCSNSDTLTKSRELLSAAKAKTGQGSGHNLGGNTFGLPAICAYLASQLVGNDDVTERMAQQASCLSLKAFRTAMNTTRSALMPYLEQSQDGSADTADTMFQELVQIYNITDSAAEWMKEVFTILRKSKTLEHGCFDPYSKEVQCAIFAWVAVSLHFRKVKAADVLRRYAISASDFRTITRMIDDNCSQVQTKMDRYLSQTPSRSSTTPSPKKNSATRAFSINTLVQKRDRALNDSPRSPKKRKIGHSFGDTPSQQSVELSIQLTEESGIPPTQKGKGDEISNNPESASAELGNVSTNTAKARNSTVAVSSIRNKSSAKDTIVKGSAGRSDNIPVPRQIQRQIRVAFRDRLFWQYRDPCVIAEWKACEEYAGRLGSIAAL